MLRSVPRPSPAMVVACLALFVALSGTSYAVLVLPANSVGTVQLKKNAVVSVKVKDHSLLAADFKPGQLPAGISGYQIVEGAPNIVTNQIFNSLLISCPPGKKAVGGGGGTGGGIVPGDGPYIVFDGPSVGGASWLIQTARATSGPSTLTGRVICADVP